VKSRGGRGIWSLDSLLSESDEPKTTNRVFEKKNHLNTKQRNRPRNPRNNQAGATGSEGYEEFLEGKL